MNIERNFSIVSKSFLVQNLHNRSRKKKNTPFKSFKKKMVGSQNIYLIIYFVHKICVYRIKSEDNHCKYILEFGTVAV